MHRVNRVFLALEPIAWNLGLDDLAEAVLPREEFPVRHERPRLGTEIGPYEPAQFLDRIGLDADLVAQPRLRVRHVLIGLRQAAAVRVVEPAVIIAAQPAFLDIAIAQVGAAVPAMAIEEAVCAAEILVEDKVLAHQPHRKRAGAFELAGAGDRPPIAAQEIAHRGTGAGPRQNIPAAARLGAAILRHDQFRAFSSIRDKRP